MTAEFDASDRALLASLGEITRGMSPAAFGLAFADWLIHVATQPSRGAQHLLAAWQRLVPHVPTPDTPHPHSLDTRLDEAPWDAWPFRSWRDAWLAMAETADDVTRDVPGVERHHGALVNFAITRWLLAASPANFTLTNPVVLQRTLATQGLNLVDGAMHWLEDCSRQQRRLPPAGAEAFQPGAKVAITPGKVILRNRLMELIQYAPATPQVHAEPVLVVSAWIMKYYVLDLSPQDSFIGYLVRQGHTVFAISWRNPAPEDKDLGMADYLQLGVMAALDAIGAVAPHRPVHAIGYCLGGTLMAMTAAAMARDRDERLASLTLLAAQTDFSEPGELGLFIDESQLSFLDCLMSRQGYLDASQMAGAFALLRPLELIWKPMVHKYLLGERPHMTDLLAWNADGTRMPWRMHADYLRSLFLENNLARGKLQVGGSPVSLGDIKVPIFAVGTTTDHVAPWRSVYKIHLLCDGDITFVLTDGGHNAGIVSEPGHAGRHYRLAHRAAGAPYRSPDDFLEQADTHSGSWWPAIADWLARHSGPKRRPPTMGSARRGYAPIQDAPGSYVLTR